jgi:hypothetical protein
MIKWAWDENLYQWRRYTIEGNHITSIHYLPVVEGKTNIPAVRRDNRSRG